MKDARIIFGILFILVILTTGSGCGIIGVPSAGSELTDQSGTAVFTKDRVKDEQAQQLIKEYFAVLFDVPSVDEYTQNTRTGIIPEKIRGFITEQTLYEGDGNPEVGIHLPRYVGLNGMTIIGYEPVVFENNEADVHCGYLGKNGDSLLYFCKIKARAKVVPDDIFAQSFGLRDDNTYLMQKDIEPDLMDTIRLEIRYDVELIEENGQLKIFRAVESNMKPGMKNRVFRMNNENITRLPFLDVSRTEDGGAYNHPADGDIYEAEKALIAQFFNNLTVLDRERMNLLAYKWEQGYGEILNYWDSLGISKDEEGNTEIINLTPEYDQNYPYKSLPLRYNMERIKEITNINVEQHPAYTEKQKWYFVRFDANVQKMNGITDEDFLYRYDYLVILSEAEETLIIEKIKLNEYYAIKK